MGYTIGGSLAVATLPSRRSQSLLAGPLASPSTGGSSLRSGSQLVPVATDLFRVYSLFSAVANPFYSRGCADADSRTGRCGLPETAVALSAVFRSPIPRRSIAETVRKSYCEADGRLAR